MTLLTPLYATIVGSWLNFNRLLKAEFADGISSPLQSDLPPLRALCAGSYFNRSGWKQATE
jgi:hypothetical protein